MTITYEVREQTSTTNPADRGTLIAFYETCRDAFRLWQQLDASGRKAYVVRSEAK